MYKTKQPNPKNTHTDQVEYRSFTSRHVATDTPIDSLIDTPIDSLIDTLATLYSQNFLNNDEAGQIFTKAQSRAGDHRAEEWNRCTRDRRWRGCHDELPSQKGQGHSARQESRLVRHAVGARLHDAGLVASGKPKLGCPFGGRYSEEKGGSAQTHGYRARTGKRPRTGPTIDQLSLKNKNFHSIYQKIVPFMTGIRRFHWGCCYRGLSGMRQLRGRAGCAPLF